MGKSNSSGIWTTTNGVASWSAGTLYPKSSYELKVPGAATSFSVATPSSRTKEFSLTSTITQLGDGANIPYSSFTGQAQSEDKIKISDAGTITDELFTNFSSVEELSLKNSAGYTVTVGAQAQEAGIREIDGSSGNDSIDAHAYTTGLEIEGGRGNDSIIGGEAGDELEGGFGADELDLQHGGSDKIEYDSFLDGSSVPNTGDTIFSGNDIITGFTTGDDCVEIDFDFNSIQGPATIDPGDLDDFAVADLSSVANVSAAITSLLPSSGVDDMSVRVLFLLNDGTSSGLYTATIADTDLTPTVTNFNISDITMLGLFNNATLVAGDLC